VIELLKKTEKHWVHQKLHNLIARRVAWIYVDRDPYENPLSLAESYADMLYDPKYMDLDALNNIGYFYLAKGNLMRAKPFLIEGLRQAKEYEKEKRPVIGRWPLELLYYNYGILLALSEEYLRAKEHLEIAREKLSDYTGPVGAGAMLKLNIENDNISTNEQFEIDDIESIMESTIQTLQSKLH
jgi:tetratricopeptide (TPR) repeat protein